MLLRHTKLSSSAELQHAPSHNSTHHRVHSTELRQNVCYGTAISKQSVRQLSCPSSAAGCVGAAMSVASSSMQSRSVSAAAARSADAEAVAGSAGLLGDRMPSCHTQRRARPLRCVHASPAATATLPVEGRRTGTRRRVAARRQVPPTPPPPFLPPFASLRHLKPSTGCLRSLAVSPCQTPLQLLSCRLPCR